MSKKQFIRYDADPEMTIGCAITEAVELSKRAHKPVVAHVRGIAVRVNRHTSLDDGVSRYRQAVECLTRIRT